MGPARPNDALAWMALGAGLALAAFAGVVSPWMDAQVLPLLGDPQAFARAYAQLSERSQGVGLALGFAALVLLLADMSRLPDLSGRRARLRLAGLTAIVAQASLVGFLEAPFVQSLAGGELATEAGIRAALDARAPVGWLASALGLATGIAFVLAHRAPLTARPPAGAERYAAPWVPPVFGRTPELPARQWRVLGLMVMAGAFNSYDHQIFSLALKQIQEGLAIGEGQLGLLGSLVRFGVVPGVIGALLADTFGRRRVLLVTIVGYTAATGATAFAPDMASFAVLQFLARAFGAAEAVVAAVVVAEEIDPAERGWALGVLAGLSAAGAALAWVLFAFVDVMPLGWRGLYLVGIAPLLLLTWLRRSLPESDRFARTHTARARAALGGVWRELLQPLQKLARAYPDRFAAAAFVAFGMSFSGQLAGFFFPKWAQDAHGVEPSQLALVAAAAGLAGLAAHPLVGRLGDRIGRKPVAILFVVLNPLCVIALYHALGLVGLALGFFAVTMTDSGSETNLGAYARELFPTSYRSTAGGALAVVGQVGGSLGLAAESLLYAWTGSHATAISIIAATGLLVPFVIAWVYPETSGRPLEETAPER